MKAKFIIVLLMCSLALGTPILYKDTVDAWATINQNTVREGATTDIRDWDIAWLHISSAITSETPHIGTRFWIQVSAADTGDGNWSLFSSTLGPTGTANDIELKADLNTSTTTIYCSDTSGAFDDDGIVWIFLQGSATVANSSVCMITAHGANASMTILDPPAYTHISSTRVYDIADSFSLVLPKSAARVRVVYDNTFDADGASVTTRCDITGFKL